MFFHFNNVDADFVVNPCLTTYFGYVATAAISVCVPLLLLVNGALVFNRTFDASKTFRKSIRMAVLCIAWNILTLSALMLLNGETFEPAQYLYDLLTWKQHYTNHLWFLQTLAMAYIVMLLLVPAWQGRTKGFRYFFLAVCALVIGNAFLQAGANAAQHLLGRRFIDVNYMFSNVFQIFNGKLSYALVYLMLGGVLSSVLTSIRARMKWWGLVGIILVSWLGIVLFGVFESRMSGQRYVFSTQMFESFFAFTGACAIFVLSLSYSGGGLFGRLTAFIGQNTLSVYLLHVIVCNVIWQSKLIVFQGTMFSLLMALLTVMLCAGLGAGLKRIPVIRELFAF